MGLENIFEKIEKNESEKRELFEMLKNILSQIESITEFNENELKSISILQSDVYLNEYLTFYISNKKHVKRKYSREIIEALRTIANSMNASTNLSNNFLPR